MSQPVPPPSIAAEPAPPMGDKAAQGFFYAMAQLGGIKLVTLLGQYVLSWLLGDEDFGYIGLTFAVAGFGSLIAHGGMRDLLIRRWRELDRWATPAFWMCVALGMCSMLATMAAAPLAAWFFRDQRLTSLIVILAFQNLFNSIIAIPAAELSIHMRFKLLAWIHFTIAALIMGLSIMFAAMGFGPYSYILPWPIGAVVRAGLMWAFSRQRVHLRPQIRLWKHLIGDSALLIAASFFVMVTTVIDYVILGRMYPDKAVVGQYFWAYNLSTQAMQLLAVNLASVLLPSLARLQDDPQRQLSAFLRAAKALTLLVIPACLLQATLADPLIRLVFPAEWYPAIPIVSVLSLGWMLMGANLSAMNALKAQGRFVALTWFLALSAAVYVGAVYIGASLAAGIGAAVGVAIYSFVFGPLSVYAAIRPLGGTLRDTADVFLAGTVTGVAAFGTAALLAWTIPPHPLQHLLRIGLVIAVGGTIYVAVIRLVARPAAMEIWGRVQGLLRKTADAAAPIEAA